MQRQQYICPVHAHVVRPQPGQCPECKSDLVLLTREETLNHHGDFLARDHHHRHGIADDHPEHLQDDKTIIDFRKRFYVVLVLIFPVIALSSMIQHWLGVNWQFPGSEFIQLLLATAIYLSGGWPFLKGFQSELKSKTPGMMRLAGVAITVAYIYSVAIVIGLNDNDFFWELATLILIMLVGHWIVMRSVRESSKELELLVQSIPSEAHLIHKDGVVMDVNAHSLKSGDVILIKPGERVAADGTILSGMSNINESLITGESKPKEKHTGDEVIAGTINGESSLKVRVSHSANESYLSQVVRSVQDAQRSKSKTQLLADQAARWLTILALFLGVLTFFVWLVLGADAAFAAERMITVIVICCPHALALAVPLVVAYSTSRSARSGLLIKNRKAFENSRKISTIIFNKTGTLTLGELNVVRYDSLISTYTNDEILAIAAALETHSVHPIATGIVRKARELDLEIPEAFDFQALSGRGIQGIVDRKKISVVNPGFLKENKLHTDFAAPETETTVFIVVERRVAGFVSLADEVRPEARQAISVLRDHKIKTMLLTGDNKHVAKNVSDALGIDTFIAEVLPHQKLEKIRELKSKGEFVAMAGDGVNDAPALAEADVGIAIGSGSDVATEAADILLMKSNPQDAANVIMFGRQTYKKMVQNLGWAIGYNLIALPLAAGVLYSSGIVLSPVAGAVLMSISTIVVAVNARMLRLRR